MVEKILRLVELMFVLVVVMRLDLLPGLCDMPAKPVDTTGTPVCATTCVAKSFPRSSTNCAGKVLVVVVAIIILPLVFVMFETFV